MAVGGLYNVPMHPVFAATAATAATAAARRHLDQVVSVGMDARRRRICVQLAAAGLALALGLLVQALVGDAVPLAPLLFLLPAGLVGTRLLVEVLLLLAARLVTPVAPPVAAPQPAGGLSWPPASLVLAGPCGGQDRPPRCAWA